MADPVVTLTLTSYEFSRGEIQAFLDEIGNQDGFPANALITVTHDCDDKSRGAREYTLTASTAYRTASDS